MTEKRKLSLAWIVVGILLVIIIAGGIYIYNDLNQAKAAQQAQAAMRNPAVQAATSLLRLQNDPKLALTEEQKAKVKPILQELIDTQTPSQEFLREKADAITAALTDEQRTFVNSRGPGRGGQNSNGNFNRDNTQRNWNGQRPNGGSFNGGAQNRQRFQPQDIYKQVLDALQ